MSANRDQQRAAHAYACVEAIQRRDKDPELRAGYKTLANDFGSHVLRSGLCAALAFIERDSKKQGGKATAANLFLKDLAGAMAPGLTPRNGLALPEHVRQLALQDYMLATRELLKTAIWFRRAVQALLMEESNDAQAAR